MRVSQSVLLIILIVVPEVRMSLNCVNAWNALSLNESESMRPFHNSFVRVSFHGSHFKHGGRF